MTRQYELGERTYTSVGVLGYRAAWVCDQCATVTMDQDLHDRFCPWKPAILTVPNEITEEQAGQIRSLFNAPRDRP